MAILDEVKRSLRAGAAVYDYEARSLINSAIYDMGRVGVNPEILPADADADEETVNPFVMTGITAYCKANFGYDVPEAERFDRAYRRIVCDLLNSSENIAAIAEEGGEEA